jgi:alpha-glucosidase
MYYGSEIGLSQSQAGTTPWCREPMPWDEARWNTALRGRVRALVRVRRDTLALQRGTLTFLLAGEDAVAIQREYTHADGRTERAVAVASRRAGAHPVALTRPGGEWRDALSGAAVPAGTVTLDAAGGRLLVQP